MPRHPVHTLLAEAAYAGREVNEPELEELRLEPADNALVRKAGREAAFLHAGAERGRAHEHALRRSHEIVAGLPEDQRERAHLAMRAGKLSAAKAAKIKAEHQEPHRLYWHAYEKARALQKAHGA